MENIYILGSVNMDLVIRVDTVPQQGQTLLGSDFLMNPGGKGANQAVAVARSGGSAKFIGAVGHAFGDELLKALQKYHVDISNIKKIENISSGVAVIVVSEGDNRIIVDPSANAKVDIPFVVNALKEAKRGDYLIAQLETPIPTVEGAFLEAKKRGIITCLNTAPAAILPADMFKNIDYICLNASETKFYTGVNPQSEASAKAAAKILLALGVKNVVITLGEEGAVLVNEKEQLYIHSLKVNTVDTTAAGDTFFGAFIAELSQGGTHLEALHFAAAAAALCVTKRGAQQAIPSRVETQAFLRNRHG